MNTNIIRLSHTLHQYPAMLLDWHTDTISVTNSGLLFTVRTARYTGPVIVTHDPDTLYTVKFLNADLPFIGARDPEHVLDIIKDFVEEGEVYL